MQRRKGIRKRRTGEEEPPISEGEGYEKTKVKREKDRIHEEKRQTGAWRRNWGSSLKRGSRSVQERTG